MRTRIALGTFAVVLSPVVAQADDAPAPSGSSSACLRAPDHERALQSETIIARLMKLSDGPIESKQTLETLKTVPSTVRTGVDVIRCSEPALSPKELHDAQAFEQRALSWADKQDARITSEENARTRIVVPLCQAVWGRDNAKADIAHEKANPSGVVDLVRLHADGEAVQYWQSQIDALTPLYVAARHHAFTTWQAEGACVADASKPDGS